jgi:hypothetical protein
MKYDIIEAGDTDELISAVNKRMEVGWICRGGFVIDNGMLYQAVSHPSDGAKISGSTESSGACRVCGNANCTNIVHSKITDLESLVGDLRKI